MDRLKRKPMRNKLKRIYSRPKQIPKLLGKKHSKRELPHSKPSKLQQQPDKQELNRRRHKEHVQE